MPKSVFLDDETFYFLHQDLKLLWQLSRAALGPGGLHAAFQKGAAFPVLIKSGEELLKQLSDKNSLYKKISNALCEDKKKCADGIKTTLILACFIFNELSFHLAEGADFNALKSEFKIGAESVLNRLDQMSQKRIEKRELLQIATHIAEGNRGIAIDVIAALEEAGADGFILVADSNSLLTEKKKIATMTLSAGYLSPYFINCVEKMSVEFKACKLFITEKEITTIKELATILEKADLRKESQVLLIAAGFTDEVTAALVTNTLQGGLCLCAVKLPEDRDRELLLDLAAVTSATVLLSEMEFKEVSSAHFGYAQSVLVTKEITTILNQGFSNKKESRAAFLRQQIKKEPDEKLKQRLSNLLGNTLLVEIGASTLKEQQQKKQLFEKTLYAMQYGIEEGVVLGAGSSLAEAAEKLVEIKRENLGISILAKALKIPAVACAANCCKERFSEEELTELSVFDPTFIVKNAVRKSINLAFDLLSSYQ